MWSSIGSWIVSQLTTENSFLLLAAGALWTYLKHTKAGWLEQKIEDYAHTAFHLALAAGVDPVQLKQAATATVRAMLDAVGVKWNAVIAALVDHALSSLAAELAKEQAQLQLDMEMVAKKAQLIVDTWNGAEAAGLAKGRQLADMMTILKPDVPSPANPAPANPAPTNPPTTATAGAAP